MAYAALDLFAPAFSNWRLKWLFTAIVVSMVYLATFAMAAETGLAMLAITWNRSMQNHMTVEVPAPADDAAVSQDMQVKQALSILRSIPEIESAEAVPPEETARLLKPWLGDAALVKQLPLPALIDVERAGGSGLTTADLQERLKGIAAGITADDHSGWLGGMMPLAEGLLALAALIVLLTGGVLMIAVGLVCRAVMASEREMIEMLHTMGATDQAIAQHFQTHTRRMSWPAASLGFLLAFVTLALLILCMLQGTGDLSLPVTHWLVAGFAAGLVPLAAVFGASSSARVAVLKFLHQLP